MRGDYHESHNTILIFGVGLLVIALALMDLDIYPKHAFDAGDCFKQKAERWEEPLVCRVKQAGDIKYVYECPFFMNGIADTGLERYEGLVKIIDKDYEKVPCGDLFK